MAVDLGLRERKKLKTRRTISEAAARLFMEQGVDATTVEQICEAAEVSPSTFFRYFPSKEAAAFGDEETRFALVERVLSERAPGEPWVSATRRAALALIEYDLETGKDVPGRVALMEKEPAIAHFALKSQAENVDRFTRLLAEQAGVDPERDMRPRLVVSAAFAAVNAAINVWLAGGMRGSLQARIEEAFDLFDRGLADLR
jgi:AcrR family transcriptional regulator